MSNNEIEIEFRYLVKRDPALVLKDLEGCDSMHVNQGYFNTSPGHAFRVRTRDPKSTMAATMTYKTGDGVVRTEKQMKIPDDVAEFIYRASEYKLEKTRYKRDGWEVDFYHGPLEGLILAEYELPAGVTVVTDARGDVYLPERVPEWLRPAIEVTNSINNLQLARLTTSLNDMLLKLGPII